MEGLPQTPTTPEPAAEQHPTKGRCCRCGQKLGRLWLWEFGRWLADRWCSDTCYQAEQQSHDARAKAAIMARRASATQRDGRAA